MPTQPDWDDWDPRHAYGNWPECGHGWEVTVEAGAASIRCDGPCHCPWIVDESTRVTFLLPRPRALRGGKDAT